MIFFNRDNDYDTGAAEKALKDIQVLNENGGYKKFSDPIEKGVTNCLAKKNSICNNKYFETACFC